MVQRLSLQKETPSSRPATIDPWPWEGVLLVRLFLGHLRRSFR